MTTTMPIVRRHVKQLSNRDLDVLVDRHIIKYRGHCRGTYDYKYQVGSAHIYRCGFCADRTAMSVSDWKGVREHSRPTPCFTADMDLAVFVKDIIHVRTSVSTQVCYITALRALCPPGIAQIPWLLLAVRPRDIVLAALSAVGVIDVQDYTAGGKDTHF